MAAKLILSFVLVVLTTVECAFDGRSPGIAKAVQDILNDIARDDALNDIPHRELKGEEIGGNFQGDMILSKEQFRNLNYSPRNGIRDSRFRWPKNDKGKVIVPYIFNGDHGKDY